MGDMLAKLIAQRQSLINSIGITQEKIYNYMAVTEIANTIMDMVKVKDVLLYSEIKDELSKNPALLEALRRIKE